MAFVGIPVPRAVTGSTTGATVALQTVEIYLAKSPGAPKHPGNRGIQGMNWSLELLGVGSVDSGTTGTDGKIILHLPPALPHVLRVLDTEYEITLRRDPVEPLTDFIGQQRRLRMLGFHLGRAGPEGNGVDNTMGPKTDRAILEFQADQGLKADGHVGSKTRAELKKQIGE